MNLLLDTSVFLWYITNDKRLSKNFLIEIENKSNDVYLSVISIWECIIKQQIGKLNFPKPTAEYLTTQRDRHNIFALPLDEFSLFFLSELPLIHKDPFDRILICQAKSNNLAIVTSDNLIKQYPVKIL